MNYENNTKAAFISRENRFVATAEIDGKAEKVHVKNTGRCRELLVPGCEVFLVRSDNPKRKYRYDLVAVRKGDKLINMDSQAPNAVFGAFLAQGGLLKQVTNWRGEYPYGASRIDFYAECRDGSRHLIEVKGVTLEQDGICRFPDAPTLRGTKHLRELIRAQVEGYHAWICFVVQIEGMRWLEPNEATDPAFAQALREAAAAGVGVKAFECHVEPDGLQITKELPVHLCVQPDKE